MNKNSINGGTSTGNYYTSQPVLDDLFLAEHPAKEYFEKSLALGKKTQSQNGLTQGAADKIIDKVQSRDRSKDSVYASVMEQKYGVRPRHLFGFINGPDEKMLVDAIYKNSGDGISPEFLCSVAFGEGLNYYHEAGFRGAEKVNGFSYLGLDNFSDDISRLKAKGYLPANFNEGDEYTVSEEVLPASESGAGKTVRSAEFKDINTAMMALKATLAHRSDVFLNDAERILGETAATKITDDEKDYWTYYYFNAGEGNGENRLRNAGTVAINKWKGSTQGEGNGYSTNPHSNSLVRVATTEYLKNSKVFLLKNDKQ
jgi:hypothetical protein